ncbi:hypothetical protein HDV00_004232 [Rhizophlyctis rosea]|nr:hypothetical protein HDV00_004232 [Rhizophlyctis rosea]
MDDILSASVTTSNEDIEALASLYKSFTNGSDEAREKYINTLNQGAYDDDKYEEAVGWWDDADIDDNVDHHNFVYLFDGDKSKKRLRIHLPCLRRMPFP